MALYTWPGWGSVGREVGKKLRDILRPFPSDNGLSESERAAHRLQDVLKGFAYLDTFDELDGWSLLDEIQRANTPLVERAPSVKSPNFKKKAKILLCHDYKGGYQDYEAVRPSTIENDLYSCEKLQFVDVFVYFSHKLVSPPPPTWTNTLHRHGTKCLGTFIVEPQTPDIHRILVKQNGHFIVADRLAEMANILGFDGWLLNIEGNFVENSTESLIEFIEYFREKLGQGKLLIWYDALNTNNQVEYQNGLTLRNIAFAKASGCLFTNYNWTEKNLRETKALAQCNEFAFADIFFGIDVWAQNSNILGSPRTTYGGGGTNTGFAVGKLAQEGFSAGVFGPAWTVEHFSNVNPSTRHRGDSLSTQVTRSLWEGATLPENLECGCWVGRPHHTNVYKQNPIVVWATEYPHGSNAYFETSFHKAFCHVENEHLQRRALPTLALQEPLPSLVPVLLSEWEGIPQARPDIAVYAEYADVQNSTVQAIAVRVRMTGPYSSKPIGSPDSRRHLCLFKVAVANDEPLLLRMRYSSDYQSTTKERSASFGFYIEFQTGGGQEHEYYQADSQSGSARYLLRARLGAVVTAIGVYYHGILEVPDQELFRCQNLSLAKESYLDAIQSCDFKIVDAKVVHRGQLPTDKQRLVWQWKGRSDLWPADLPWSTITGPFSHFVVLLNGKEIGYAHCLEFPLEHAEVLRMASSSPNTFQISAVFFCGSMAARLSGTWIELDHMSTS